MSHDGTKLVIASPNGNRLLYGYGIGVLEATDKHVLEVFNSGYHPQRFAFSPDDALAYVVHTDRDIDVFSTETFEPLDTWQFVGRYDGATEDITSDRKGRYLIAAKPDHISILVTDRVVVPEPAVLTLIVFRCARIFCSPTSSPVKRFLQIGAQSCLRTASPNLSYLRPNALIFSATLRETSRPYTTNDRCK